MENGAKPAAVSQEEAEALEQIAAEFSATKVQDEVVVSTGVKFSIKRVSAELMRRLGEQRPAPVPPKWRNPKKDREEENPNDPDYLDAVKTYRLEIGTRAMHLFLMFGTEPVEIPEGVEGPDSKDWAEALAYVGVAVPESGKVRYLRWLLEYHLSGEDDIQNLFLAVLHKSGVLREELVAQAINSFRGGDERGADSPSSSEEHSGHRPAAELLDSGAGLRNGGA